jgi:hypothetical protein
VSVVLGSLLRVSCGLTFRPGMISGSGTYAAGCIRSRNETRRHTGWTLTASADRRAAHHDTPAVAIPDAYELDDLTFALLWACASLDTGLQLDDQELTMAVGELAPYESLPSSAVSREAAAELGMTSQIWLGSDFCARHVLPPIASSVLSQK